MCKSNKASRREYRLEEKSEQPDIYRQAAKRVKARMQLYNEAMIYGLVSVMLISIYLFTTPGGYPWFIWPMAGWGMALAFRFKALSSRFNWQQNRRQLVEREMYQMGYNPYNSANNMTWPAVSNDASLNKSGFDNISSEW